MNSLLCWSNFLLVYAVKMISKSGKQIKSKLVEVMGKGRLGPYMGPFNFFSVCCLFEKIMIFLIFISFTVGGDIGHRSLFDAIV